MVDRICTPSFPCWNRVKLVETLGATTVVLVSPAGSSTVSNCVWCYIWLLFSIPTVNGVLDLNAMPECKNPCGDRNHKMLCCLCCASGPISAIIHTNRTGYVPGKWTLFILRAWVSTGANGAWHLRNFLTIMSGTRWFWQLYYIMFYFTLEFLRIY